MVPRRDNNVKILVGQGRELICLSLEGKQRNCISLCKHRTIGDYAVELPHKNGFVIKTNNSKTHKKASAFEQRLSSKIYITRLINEWLTLY